MISHFACRSIAQRLAKRAAEALPTTIPPIPGTPPPLTVPEQPATVGEGVPKIPAPVTSAALPDVNSEWRNDYFNQTKFDPAELVKLPSYQRLLKSRLPGEQAMTPEQYLPQARQTAEDFGRTSDPGRFAGFRMRQYQADPTQFPGEQFQTEQAELLGRMTPEQQAEFSDRRAKGVFGDKAYDVLARRGAAGQPLPTGVAGIAGSLASGSVMQDLQDAKQLADRFAGGQTDPAAQQELNDALAAKQSPGQIVDQQLANKAADTVAPLLTKPDVPTSMLDTTKNFFSDVRNWAIPLGALAMLFGGSKMKILGGMAMLGGAADLYGRYKGIQAMGASPEGQAAYKEGVTYVDPQGHHQAFGNLQELMTKYPEQARALKDTSLMFDLGLRGLADKQVISKALQTMASMGVRPEVALTTLVKRKLIDQQQADSFRQDMAEQAKAVAERQAKQQAEARGGA